jgi:hypothetical protein
LSRGKAQDSGWRLLYLLFGHSHEKEKAKNDCPKNIRRQKSGERRAPSE